MIVAIAAEDPQLRRRRAYVVQAAPLEDFRLPDGWPASAALPDDGPAWVVRLIGGPVRARLYRVGKVCGTRLTPYLVVNEPLLVPLRSRRRVAWRLWSAVERGAEWLNAQYQKTWWRRWRAKMEWSERKEDHARVLTFFLKCPDDRARYCRELVNEIAADDPKSRLCWERQFSVAADIDLARFYIMHEHEALVPKLKLARIRWRLLCWVRLAAWWARMALYIAAGTLTLWCVFRVLRI